MWTGVNRVFEKDQKTNVQIWHADRVGNQVINDQKMIFLTEFAASCGLTVAKIAFKKAGGYKEGRNECIRRSGTDFPHDCVGMRLSSNFCAADTSQYSSKRQPEPYFNTVEAYSEH